MTTLTQKLIDSGLSPTPIYLPNAVTPDQVWVFPEGWASVYDPHLPSDSLVSANTSQTVDGQTSVTITSAWKLSGNVDPEALLTAIDDPAPDGSEVVHYRQNGPEVGRYSVATELHVVYMVGHLRLTGFTQFNLITTGGNQNSGGAVLLQRTLNSPADTAQPQCAELAHNLVDILLSRLGRW